ncbi:hypothetical protein [Fibrobacter sp. UWEL]|uniref:hypothetical protein n=1 Tax=Fibrobacter sp. UWEL TaxID=1896209 RepID=UPI0009141137|nr:hypothetical protein [Fibrobacter sp. UWEL]SHK36722.1 hypothetical protein SAMN05720468_101228 [Fibrobacter sp. UWEL]
MAKKKKFFKSPALAQANRSKEDRLRETLTQVVNGTSRLLNRPDDLYEAIANGIDDIEKLTDPKLQLELLAWTLRTDFLTFKTDDEEEQSYWEGLYYDAGTFFVEIAKQFEDKDYVADLIHDLAVRHVGGEGRSVLFLSVEEVMPVERASKLLNELLEEEDQFADENREDVLDAICDMADAINDGTNYAKASLLKDPDKSNTTLLDIANAYLTSGNLAMAKQWLNDVKNPGNEDEEAYLDIQAAIADREGRQMDCMKIARELYEKFPKVMNLGRLCSLLPEYDVKLLLEEHEKFRCGDTADIEFMQLLAAMKRYEQLSSYVTRFEQDLAGMDADELKELADAVEKDGQKDLANHIRDWIVEEPEEAEAFDDKD